MDKAEILRYLGYKNQEIDELTEDKLRQCMDELAKISSEKFVYKYFDITGREGAISLNYGEFELQGNSIMKHLKDSNRCVLMAVTLGGQVDQRIRYYERTDMAKALILDACATAYIEEVCDKACSKIEEELNGSRLNFRFSPGYGDLPITIQKSFLRILDAEKRIGLTASESSILLPRKSVTAAAGIVHGKCSSHRGCQGCGKTDCSFKKEEN